MKRFDEGEKKVGARIITSHSSGFACLAIGASCKAICNLPFYEFINPE